VHIREIVKYEDYKRYGTNVKILYQGQEIPKGEKPPDKQTPQPQQQPQNQPQPNQNPNPQK
jgi:hypothetical protein